MDVGLKYLTSPAPLDPAPSRPFVSARPQLNAQLPYYQFEFSIPIKANLTELIKYRFFDAYATYNPTNQPLEKQICFEAWRNPNPNPSRAKQDV